MSNQQVATINNDSIQNLHPRKPYKRLDESKTKALALAGMNKADIAKHQGVEVSTVWRFLQRNNIHSVSLEYYRKNRAEILSTLQCNDLELHSRIVKSYLDAPSESLDSIPHSAKIGLINVLNNSFGTKYDKERLEAGLSTSNIAYADMIQARDKVRAEQAQLRQSVTVDVDNP